MKSTTTSSMIPDNPSKCVEARCEYKCCVGSHCGTLYECNTWLISLIAALVLISAFCILVFVLWKLRVRQNIAPEAKPTEVQLSETTTTKIPRMSKIYRNSSISSESVINESTVIEMEGVNRKYSDLSISQQRPFPKELDSTPTFVNYCIQRQSIQESNETHNGSLCRGYVDRTFDNAVLSLSPGSREDEEFREDPYGLLRYSTVVMQSERKKSRNNIKLNLESLKSMDHDPSRGENEMTFGGVRPTL